MMHFSTRINRLVGSGLLIALLIVPAPDRAAHTLLQEKPKSLAITYALTPLPDAEPPALRVEIFIPVVNPNEDIRLQMPTWSPGDYHIQNHARFVQDIHGDCVDEDAFFNVQKEDANTWTIRPRPCKGVIISYTVPNTPPGFFSENVRVEKNFAFANGPAALMYIVGRKDAPVTLLFRRLPRNWRVETALPPEKTLQTEQKDPVVFSAPDFDTLADSPIVMADKDVMKVREFSVGGKPHKAVFFGNVPRTMDADAWVPVLKRIVEAEAKLMGGMPYDRYTFFFDVNGRGGGLEHANSARMAIGAGSDPKRTAGFIAHEFFHAWNVKRIRPRVLGPFDYITPPKTRNLWFAEGVTDYYAQIAMRRAGLTSENDFLGQWRNAIEWYQQVPARRRVSADESSLRVWEANNSTGYGGLNYYQKGELIGLCLDLKIRHVTENRRSLDDVMRELFKRTTPPKPGYGEDEIREVVNLVAGQDLTAFYNLLARSTEEMPFAECLSYAGLDTDLKELPHVTAKQLALRKAWMRHDP
jgi:predicted metalloprotease with PDZ domain